MNTQLLAQAPAATAVKPVPRRARRFGITVAVILGTLALGETVLQVRSYIKSGRSAVDLVTGETAVAMNDAYGVRTYRPNFTLKMPDPKFRFVTNSQGFRSPEIAPRQAPGEYRIVVVGASTVAGAYSKTNELTFPGQLETALRKTLRVPVDVVNAGVEGYTIADIERLIDRALIKQAPSMMLVYSGYNDLSAICGATRPRKTDRWDVPQPALPHWVLSRQLISKNTLALREPPIRLGIVDPARYFPASYGATLDRIVIKLKAANIVPVLLTNARSYRGVAHKEAAKLAESSLFYHSCMNLDGLHKASEMFNRTIADVARKHDVKLIDLAAAIPSGRAHFVDAHHFTLKGDTVAAQVIHAALADVIVPR
ncbi:SGNH/GDSL hydrolase family protein [Massilia sp.]|uniref:SGNH/GDSL hydrolase family protein n=1 Tax=Massilia sp. TaxID=1882437 RepID=UPI00289A6C1B|nr:SGNH/GDSL hydrolase family protein [Massilia sp.]